VHFKIRRQ